jgi:ABC-2 type transport system ATP-binding protein
VTLALPAARADGIKVRLKSLTGVASVEQTERSDGSIELTAFPRSGALLIESVSALAASEKWDVTELYAEPGRLDEVFRAMTTHDAKRAREIRA